VGINQNAHPVNRLFLFLLFILTTLISGCQFFQSHFITDPDYRSRVEQRFEEQRHACSHREAALFEVFNQDLSLQEREALSFLYAYAPTSDMADYDGEFFLHNVRTSLEIRDFFPWGKEVPEEIFRHFVLPIRVNNESLDSSRWIFFEELKERLQGLDMERAALEVNHWCHEKVMYRGTDGRTSSPLNTVKTAFGRCGEESTFTVAAMRAVGIPARQCYTPRWAHSDDNHAWVEVWVNGKWHFLGACEPEPRLNMGWFAGPSLRTMLVSTNVYGEYFGPEEVLVRNRFFTRINLLPNYTQTKVVKALVLDSLGQPAVGARVDFCLYNYAEFFPLTSVTTGSDGLAFFTTGFGDLVVWASRNNQFDLAKLDCRISDTLSLRLNANPRLAIQELDLVPPVEKDPVIEVGEEEKRLNATRLKMEDSIRDLYVASFPNLESTLAFAQETATDPERLSSIIRKARGNAGEIQALIRQVKPAQRPMLLSFLESISEKDLHDATASTLFEHFDLGMKLPMPEGIEKEDFARFVLSPRIGLEYLRPFQEVILAARLPNPNPHTGGDPQALVRWILKELVINDSANSYRSPISPAGVLALRAADRPSRDVFFVAVCRSLGLPARLEPASRKPQCWQDGGWQTISFEAGVKPAPQGRIRFETNVPPEVFFPVYSTHFAIGRRTAGLFQTLDYEADPILSRFPAEVSVESGEYMLVAGNRLSNGTVLAHLEFFDLQPNQSHTLLLQQRLPRNGYAPLGRVATDAALTIAGQKTSLDALMNNKPIVLFWPEPGKEPTRHVLAELEPLRKELEQAGAHFLIPLSGNAQAAFRKDVLPFLPSNTQLINPQPELLTQLAQACRKQEPFAYPVVAFIRPGGEIWFFNSGYSIGTGQALLRLFKDAK
jgi:hypothetical protein